MSPVHLWLRAEVKPNERRVILTPSACKKLITSGNFVITVENFPSRAIPDMHYEKVGCSMVATGSWITNAPCDAFILGLKELPDCNDPLHHAHIYFAHCFKNQANWKQLLARFDKGKGRILDLEFLTNECGRRVAAFGYMAGFCGAAVGMDIWCQKQLTCSNDDRYDFIESKPDIDTLVAEIKDKLKATMSVNGGLWPTVLVIGALGRCGTGSCDFARRVGLPEENIIKWDIEETKGGGPFPAILDADILINCIYLTSKITPFLNVDMIDAHIERRLSVVVDVSCDSTNPNNPLPFYTGSTTFDAPVTNASITTTPSLSVVAIDHLPTLLPKESSEMFATDILPTIEQLTEVNTAPVWVRAQQLFEEKLSESKKGSI